MRTLADGLSALNVLSMRTVPVSRASFTLTDRDAFDAATRIAVTWMSRTARAQLPPEASAGEPFEIPVDTTKAAGSALRLDNDQGRIWAAQIAYLGDRAAQREWITDLFVEHRIGAFVRFGAQLSCRCSIGDPGFDHSRPRVVQDVLATLAGGADGDALSNEIQTVAQDDVEALVDLLYRPSRRLPVVLVSVDDTGGAQLDLRDLATRLSGTAHLRCIGSDASYDLTRLIGKRMSTFNRAVRLYMPGLEQETEDPFKNPLWLTPNSGWNPRLLNLLAARVLPLGFQDAEGDARFWRVGLLRQAVSRAIADAGSGTWEEQLQAEIEALRADLAVAREAEQAAEALMYEEASKLSEARAACSRLEDESAKLRNCLLINANKGGLPGALSADDVHALFDQTPVLEVSLRIVASVFPDRIVVLTSAYEAAQASSSFKYRKRAFELLWKLATTYWTALLDGESDVTARKCFGAAFAAKETETLSKAGRRRRTFDHAGMEITMERHLKIGVADNRADTLRIHFEWLGAEKIIVIGHCGGHLNF